MRPMWFAALALLPGAAAAEAGNSLPATVSLLPMPASIAPKAGAFALAGSALSFDPRDAGAAAAAAPRLNALLDRPRLPVP